MDGRSISLPDLAGSLLNGRPGNLQAPSRRRACDGAGLSLEEALGLIATRPFAAIDTLKAMSQRDAICDLHELPDLHEPTIYSRRAVALRPAARRSAARRPAVRRSAARRSAASRALVTLLLLCAALTPFRPSAQVLARPGWAGSGVAPEAWWRRAVFYRIDPVRFQDSDGDGRGDLPGVMARLDYLQSLGVDALVLDGQKADGQTPASQGPDSQQDAAGVGDLDDLVREASRHHLRLLLTVTPQLQGAGRLTVLATVHGWLNAGAAGVYLPKPVAAPSLDAAHLAAYGDLATALRAMLRQFPGERVLLADPAPQPKGLQRPGEGLPQPGNAAPRPLRLRHRLELAPAAEPGGQLTTLAALRVQPPDAAALRGSLEAIAEDSPENTPLLRFAAAPATGSPEAAAAAALLLASRGAALFNFGDEIGLSIAPETIAPQTSAPEASAPDPAADLVMQWTPVNVQQAPIERPSAPALGPNGETQFGAFHPYVHPPPRTLTGPSPASPHVSIDTNLPEALPDPNTLPGFTTGPLPAEPLEGVRLNVTTQDRDPNSLLNAYRQLIALHHDNATLRNGTQTVLNRATGDAVVWIRRAPAGSRTAANLLIAANLGATPLRLDLDADLEQQGMRPGILRALFAWSPTPLTGESTGTLNLPPHAVFIGEIFHAGGLAGEGSSGSGRRSRRRRR